MNIKESIADYKHLDIGNIKIAFTIVCKDDLFENIYFNSNSIYLVKSGKAFITSETDSIELKRGEAVLIKQHAKLNIKKFRDKNGDNFQSFIFQLFPDFVREFAEKNNNFTLLEEDSDLILIEDAEKFYLFSKSLDEYLEKPSTNYNQLIKAKTIEAVNLLISQNSNLLHFLLQHSQPIKIDLYEYMIHNVLSNNSVEEMAQLTGRSLSSFKRDFKAIFNTSPHRWILNQKMDMAEEILKTKQMKSSDLYLFLGFNELSHFSMTYKKIKGVPPTQV
jgi:AraC-like DNA-binding protein